MQRENRKILISLLIAGVFTFLIVASKLIETGLNKDFGIWGIFPRKASGLAGILISPFIHADFRHLFSNLIPLFLLLTAILYYYKTIAYKVLLWTYLLSGICVWLSARSAYHIGASGLIYGWVSFLFLSGILRKDTRLLAISLLVTFLYGSMVWGILPLAHDISWESHLYGAVSGIFCAFYFRKQGPQRKKYAWEEESDRGSLHYKDFINKK